MKNLSTIYRLLLVMLFVISFGYINAKTNTVFDCDTPVITTQPVNDTVCSNDLEACFHITANGTGGMYGLEYEWQVNTGSGFADVIFYDYTNPYYYYGEPADGFLCVYYEDSAAYTNGYQFRCIVNGACGSDTSDTAILTVSSAPYIISDPVNTVICASSNATFNVTLSDTGRFAYQWQENQGSGFSNISNGGVYSGVETDTLKITSAAFAMNGYLYRCVVTGACNPVSSWATLIVVNAPPSILYQPVNDTICSGTYAYFSVCPNQNNGMSFDWQENRGSGFSDIILDYDYDEFNIVSSELYIWNVPDSMNGYQYRCIIIGPCSPPDTSTIATLIINSLPTVTASASSSLICYNSCSTLTAIGASTYTWSPATGLSTTTGSSVTATLTATTTYTVTGTNTNGCTNTAYDTIIVSPEPTVSAGTNANICSTDSIMIGGHPTASGCNFPFYYSWVSNPSGFTSNISNPMVDPTVTTTYYVTVTDSIGGDTLTDSVTIIPGYINNTFTYTDTVCVGTNDTLTADLSGAIYSWLVSCSLSSDTACGGQCLILNTDTAGAYEVCLKVTDGICSSLPYCKIIYFDSCSDGHFMLLKKKIDPTSTYESIAVYPTIINDQTQLSVIIPTSNTGFIDIYNLLGEKIREFILLQGSNQLSLSSYDLAAGFYIYRVTLNDNTVKIGKIMWNH